MRVFTNEAATVNALRRADERLLVESWDDPLAFGRLFSALDLDAYATSRAQVFSAAGWDEDGVAEADLMLRNEALKEALESGEDIYLLFGGSLLDQLQLSQILFWLSFHSERALKQVRVMVIDGPLCVFEEGALLEVAREGEALDFPMLDAYRSAWMAVTAPDVSHVEFAYRRLQSGPWSSLCAALERWLQELPSSENGLSISQCQILDAVRLGIGFPQELFEAVDQTEAASFRTNWEFWQLLDHLCSGQDPLLAVAGGRPFLCPPRALAWIPFHDQKLELTERGRALLDGRGHLMDGEVVERWLGGVRISEESRRFWDYATRAVVSQRRPTVPTA
ncbi:hypothetical protein [Pelagicoccus sp. SDUM812003]|uniref:hypothetical protein n=1 Tax=Pelagicoccus sp. SDUM812003 TaxID=3041267 RepID=UPI00280FED5B|nr:hypothetical protein [Pelagicoccus sp. SDUM812003]MDQ8201685.1 hypothetical protein [Pelagicoccus sp. SDUM812003]